MSDKKGCTYTWIGDEWSLTSDECQVPGSCSAPTTNGSFIGETVTVSCEEVKDPEYKFI